ncbi:MAG: C2H2-type zinc finger protein [Thaumarchaeota archaeon]|nr:C2H2-type zinc finger protein [Nitrososphaerota archaeon]
MDDDQKEFKCKECGMMFNDPVHLERHARVHGHKSRDGGFVQKWYWEN